MNETLVIDIGGTKTNVSFVTSHGSEIKIISSKIFSTPSNPEHAIQSISSIYSDFGKKLNYMSLSLPGSWDKNGVLKESFFLHSWLEYPFIINLANALNIKNYCFETDVICGAMGEYHVQLDTLHGSSLLYINLGTGIGAALIKDGKPYKSNSHLTLRLQKLVFPFQDELYSGVDLISGGTLLEASQYESIEALYKDYKVANVRALDIISKAQFQLSTWLINLFYLFAPGVIVLNGGLTYDFEVLLEGAIEIAKEELEEQVEIVPSKLRELAPIYGAYLQLHTTYLQECFKSK